MGMMGASNAEGIRGAVVSIHVVREREPAYHVRSVSLGSQSAGANVGVVVDVVRHVETGAGAGRRAGGE